MSHRILTRKESKAAARYQKIFRRAKRPNQPSPKDHAAMSTILIRTGLPESVLRGLEAA